MRTFARFCFLACLGLQALLLLGPSGAAERRMRAEGSGVLRS